MKKINSYEVLERVGKGGMGTVFKVRHTLRNEIFALKQLNDDSIELQKRFEYEALVLSKLSHPNIVQVSDFFSFEGELYIAMEFVEGKPLSEIIGKDVGPIVFEKAIPLFTQVLLGMAHAHQNGIVHRDIKPANIIVKNDGIVKITDFGISKILGVTMGTAGMRMGTIYYMSPEQMEGEEIDERSDIYSLGMTLYEMLAGRLPFSIANTSNPIAIIKQVHDAVIPDPREFYPHIPGNVVAAVMKAIRKNRNERFQNINQFLSALGGNYNIPAINNSPGPKISMSENIVPPGLGNTMVLVEGGKFQMAGTNEVIVDAFYMGNTQVTQELWKKIMGNNPSAFKGEKRPVEMVSWYDAIIFCNKLSESEGLQPCYKKEIREKHGFFNGLFGIHEEVIVWYSRSAGYRLPTEAEWEYAARGGIKTRNYNFSGSNDLNEVAWFGGNSRCQTHDVGTKQANELGIYDMSGNVGEWCWDNYYNPTLGGRYGAVRRGDCFESARHNLIGSRGMYDLESVHLTRGFRVARNIGLSSN